ncbi:hypothetical protein QBC47DRAFT_398496 [Echria macrotheca]|uniref:C2H2-type domain-containing protein n=1 Tax=Echria macrotheca TaxID=438768 RepID=A0AAJ0BK53_9PEZI|nr:hypothetical protein QBC47DRAFT_398496 [Echria macrotheca]
MVSTLNGPNLFSNIEQNTAFTTTQFDTSSIPINPDSALTFPPPHQQIPSTAVREAAPKLVNPGRKAPDPTIETESPRPFACPHNGCKWSFKQTRDLSRHTRTVHAGDSAKTLVCHEDNCDRAGKPFSRRDNYVKHRRNVHGISSGATTKGKRKVRELEHQLSASPGDTTPSRSRATGYQDVGSVTDDSDVSEEELGGISRETLIKMYLREKRRRRDLERKMAAQRRRQRAMFSKLLEARLDEETD